VEAVGETFAALPMLIRCASSGSTQVLLPAGLCVVEARGSRLHVVEYGCWHTRPGPPIELRLRDLFDELRGLLARHRPDTVALEESFVGADARTALSVGQVRGALIVACAQAAVACVEYPPRA
jgi:crossover junction endodeoxyribonuclease RuvC